MRQRAWQKFAQSRLRNMITRFGSSRRVGFVTHIMHHSFSQMWVQQSKLIPTVVPVISIGYCLQNAIQKNVIRPSDNRAQGILHAPSYVSGHTDVYDPLNKTIRSAAFFGHEMRIAYSSARATHASDSGNIIPTPHRSVSRLPRYQHGMPY